MRVGGTSFAIVLCVTGGLAFVACSSEVSDAPNDDGTGGSAAAATGAGGAGTTTSSTATTAASTTASSATGGTTTAAGTGPTSGSSAASGGGTVCDQACSKLANECGFGDICAQVGFDCGDPQFECPGQCVLDATCAQIVTILQQNVDPELAACLGACQGGAGGAGAGGGNPGEDCLQCGQGACPGPGIACFQDDACQAWLQCLQNCQDTACVNDCNAAHPDAAPMYEPIYECLCDSCESPCGFVDPCNQPGSGSGSGAGGAGGAGGGMN